MTKLNNDKTVYNNIYNLSNILRIKKPITKYKVRLVNQVLSFATVLYLKLKDSKSHNSKLTKDLESHIDRFIKDAKFIKKNYNG